MTDFSASDHSIKLTKYTKQRGLYEKDHYWIDFCGRLYASGMLGKNSACGHFNGCGGHFGYLHIFHNFDRNNYSGINYHSNNHNSTKGSP